MRSNMNRSVRHNDFVSWEALSSKAPPVVYTVKITRVGIFPLYSIWNIVYIP